MNNITVNDEIPKKERKLRKKPDPLSMFCHNDEKYDFEIGIDEAGRGPMFGRLYVAGVVLPKDGSMDTSEIRDSKKISKKKLPDLYKYIKEKSLAFDIQYIEASEIDEINIREAVIKGMHLCAKNIIETLDPQLNKNTFLMIDGNDFPPYYHNNNRIDYKTFLQGDNTYASIAAASILAKVSRDQYINDLCKEYPILSDIYKMNEHMGYGTKKHLDAIKMNGITPLHRKTYGLCKTAHVIPLI